MKYKAYNLKNFREIKQLEKLSEEEIFNIEVVGEIIPFKADNYVIDELIDWDNYKKDPCYILTFPQKEMLSEDHYNRIATLKKQNVERAILLKEIDQIRRELNPHPANQMQSNVPTVEGIKLQGMQHKYKETALFFPNQGQTCHAFCTFCFRWAQFIGDKELKFGMSDIDLVIQYIKENDTITDLLITGGDPMVMNSNILCGYLQKILDANIPHLTNIRIGTKSLTYWPYKYTTDEDGKKILEMLEKINKSGIRVALMAHFCHINELKTNVVKEAIENIKATGTIIRTQTPLLKHINDDAEMWSEMLKLQVNLGLIPYYMFLPRDTGAQGYFATPIYKAYHIYREAISKVSGLARTLRGPVMSCEVGKVLVHGIAEIKGEKVFISELKQSKKREYVGIPFFAKYDENAIWYSDMEPAFGEDKFFFQD